LKNSSLGVLELFGMRVLFFVPSQHALVFHELLQSFQGTSEANDENKKYNAQAIITI